MHVSDELSELYNEDFATEKLISAVDAINARVVVFGGFGDDVALAERQSDVAKQCLLREKRVLTMSFEFSTLAQLMALLNNARLFPPNTGTLKIQLSTGRYEEALDGNVLATMLANVFYSASNIGHITVWILRLGRIRHASCLFRTLFQVGTIVPQEKHRC